MEDTLQLTPSSWPRPSHGGILAAAAQAQRWRSALFGAAERRSVGRRGLGSAMEVQGELTEEDYLRAQWLHIKPRRRYRILGCCVLGLFVVTSIPVIVASISLPKPDLALSFFSPVAALLILAAWTRHTHRRTYRRQPALRGTHRYDIAEASVKSESPYGRGETDWSIFTKWRESPDLFLVYQADNLFHMLPKRWFDGDESRIEQLRALFRRHSIECVD